MNRFILTIVTVIVFYFSVNAQIGINTTTPNAKSELDVKSPSNNKGVLIPRMTTDQKNAIAPGTTEIGLCVYDTDTRSFWEWNGTKWIEIDPLGKYIAEQGLDPYEIGLNLLIHLGYFYKDPYDGRLYKSTKIGSRIWFTENFQGTKYNDGTAIPVSYYSNSYGYMVYTADIFISGKNVCPSGWHPANESDWTDLVTSLGGYHKTTSDKIRLDIIARPDAWINCPGINTSKFGASHYTMNSSEYWAYDFMPPKQMYISCDTLYLHIAGFNPGFVRCVKN